MPSPTVSRGLVLLVHGSRDRAWLEPFRRLRELVAAQRPESTVVVACLQFCPPTLEEVFAEFATVGVRQVTVAPVFLSAGGHVNEDIPVRLRAVVRRHPGIEVELLPPLGDLPGALQAVADCLVRAMNTAAAPVTA